MNPFARILSWAPAAVLAVASGPACAQLNDILSSRLGKEQLSKASLTSLSAAGSLDGNLLESATVQLYGIATPQNEVTLRSPIPGVIMNVDVAEGDSVKAGTPLVVIDNRVSLAQVEMAKVAADRSALLRRARLELDLANTQYEGTLRAHQAHASTDSELEQTRIRRDQAQAAYEAEVQTQRESQANLKLANARLAQHTISAPFDGRIVRVHTRVGANAMDEEGLITIGSLRTLEAELYLPLTIYGKLKEGQTYTLNAGPPIKSSIQAKLKLANPFIDAATRTYRCVFVIDNQSEELPSGFVVQFDLEHLKSATDLASSKDAAHHINDLPEGNADTDANEADTDELDFSVLEN